jgi:hypothetical protein
MGSQIQWVPSLLGLFLPILPFFSPTLHHPPYPTPTKPNRKLQVKKSSPEPVSSPKSPFSPTSSTFNCIGFSPLHQNQYISYGSHLTLAHQKITPTKFAHDKNAQTNLPTFVYLYMTKGLSVHDDSSPLSWKKSYTSNQRRKPHYLLCPGHDFLKCLWLPFNKQSPKGRGPRVHLCTHEEVPADLCHEIKQHFMESDETPPPPTLKVLNLDDVIMSMNYERMC